MRIPRLVLLTASLLVLVAGSAFATKQDELDAQALKPWTLRDLPQLNNILVDVFETEPNDVCPGEPYTFGDTFHGEIGPAGDVDWVYFDCTAGDRLTIGTDEDPGFPTVDTVIELWDGACANMLTSNDDGGPGLYSLIDNYEIPATGTYALKVRGFSATSSTGNYILVGDCGPPPGVGFCPIGAYKASKINVNLPVSSDLPPTVTPSIKFNPQPGCIITDVIIDINMDHTWTGDLTITLTHTSDGGVVKSIDLLQRPGVPQTTFGCSADLVGDPESKYYFSGRADLFPLGEGALCIDPIPTGCYAVAPENTVGMDIFNGQDVGDGSWQLTITDGAGGDDGFIYNWSVHILVECPVSVDDASWADIKAEYK